MWGSSHLTIPSQAGSSTSRIETPEQSASVLSHSQSKKVFLDGQTDTALFQFVPGTSCSVIGHHLKKLDCIFLKLFFEVFIYMGEISPKPSLLQVK